MNAAKHTRWIVFLFLSILPAGADTFRHLTTGETFAGFRTHRKSGDRVLVFHAEQNKFIPLNLNEYEITANQEGRNHSVMVIKIDQPEILISQVVSREVADSILKAADKGPRALIIQIDSPGGQGPYMKTVAEAITTAAERTGCPAAAYLSGGQYGGAFSAAAVVALACERIYIAPGASIGAVGPMSSAAMNDQELLQYLDHYSSDTLATFGLYASSLARRNNRPELLGRALVDKQLVIAEVRSTDGKQSLVELSQRQENQSVVRLITEGLSGDPVQGSSAAAILRDYSKLLNLSSAEALRWNMADKQVSSLAEILSDLDLASAQIVNVSSFNSTIKKFSIAQRNLGQMIAKIQLEEERVATIEQHLLEMERIALTSTVTREVNTGGQYEEYRRGTVRLRTPDRLWDRYYNEREEAPGDIPLQDRYGREIRIRSRDGYTDRERIIDEQPSGNIPEVRMQLMAVLNEMIADYQRAIGLARRWPGGLPMGISLDTLQKNMTSAQILLTSTHRRSMQGF